MRSRIPVPRPNPVHTRRALLTAGAGGAVAALGLTARGIATPTPGTGHLPPIATPATAIHVRPALHGLAPDGPEIAALRAGIAAMRDRDAADPTSWRYQANIHGIVTGTRPLTAWKTCEHNTWHFLPWHRMYLYFFERILRKASGNPAFALPYWNYANPAHRELPISFRDPASETNPLYVAARSPLVNALTLSAEERQFLQRWWNSVPKGIDDAFRQQNFLATGGISFGGAPDSEQERVKGGLELAHDTIHGIVGFNPVTEERGWMASVAMAAHDPLFWLHHANIDRLWKRWLDLGGLRASPVERTDWADRRFTFFDEDAREVTLSPREVLDTVAQLGYRYDDDPATESPAPTATPANVRSPTVAALEEGATTTFGESPGATELGPEPATIPLAPAVGGGVAEEATPLAGTVVRDRRILTIRARGTEATTGAFEVYLNLPPGVAPDPLGIHFVGVLSTFGLLPEDAASMDHDHVAPLQSFDISLNVAALEATDAWTGEIEISLVPLLLPAPAAPEATPAAEGVGEEPGGGPDLPWVVIDEIAVTN